MASACARRRRWRRGTATALAAAALATFAACGQRGPLVLPSGLPEVEPVAAPAPDADDDDDESE